MTKQEIIDSAPKGATHYADWYVVQYFKMGKNGWVFFYNNRWHGYSGSFGYDEIKPL